MQKNDDYERKELPQISKITSDLNTSHSQIKAMSTNKSVIHIHLIPVASQSYRKTAGDCLNIKMWSY